MVNLGKTRLLRLANKLDGSGPYRKVGPVPRHKFDMRDFWLSRRGGACINFSDFKPNQCKTAACAVGWAASDPWFTERGLYEEWSSAFWGLGNDINWPTETREWHWLFNPTPRQSLKVNDTYLRGRSADPTPRQQAAAIRKFVAAKWPSRKRNP